VQLHNHARSPNGNTHLLGAVETCRPVVAAVARALGLNHIEDPAVVDFGLLTGCIAFSAEYADFDMP